MAGGYIFSFAPTQLPFVDFGAPVDNDTRYPMTLCVALKVEVHCATTAAAAKAAAASGTCNDESGRLN